MNEKIKEFAIKCGAEDSRDFGASIPRDDNFEISKFAELIARECHLRVERYINECGEIGSLPTSVILNHFGVEE